jgi:hypothetical protein
VTDAANPVDDSRFDYTGYGLNDTEKDYSGLPFNAKCPYKFAGTWATTTAPAAAPTRPPTRWCSAATGSTHRASPAGSPRTPSASRGKPHPTRNETVRLVSRCGIAIASESRPSMTRQTASAICCTRRCGSSLRVSVGQGALRGGSVGFRRPHLLAAWKPRVAPCPEAWRRGETVLQGSLDSATPAG